MNESNDDTSTRGGRWGTVAASVMRRPGLSVAAKAVYTVLATYTDKHGWSWVRQERLAADLGRSRAWVHAAVAELEEADIISHDRQFIEGRQRASRYRLIDGIARSAGDRQRVETENRSGRDAFPEERRSGFPRNAVSEKSDPAVEPADTSHHDDNQIKDSLFPARGKDFSDNRGFCQDRDQEVGAASENFISEPQACDASAPETHRQAAGARQVPHTGSGELGGDRSPEMAACSAHSPICVPEDWRPSEADKAWAVARIPCLDLKAFTENFVLSCRANGYRYADINAGWRRWLIEPKGGLPMITPINRDARENHDRSAEGHFRNRHDFGQQDADGARRQRPNRDTSCKAKPGAGETRLAAWASAANRRHQTRPVHG
jgi:hypothetical protein